MKVRLFLFFFSLSFVLLSKSQNCDLLSIDSGFPIIRGSTCGLDNGSIEVRASGNGVVRYSLNGGPFQNSGLFNNLSLGIYEIRMRDENNCESMISIPLEAEASVNITNVSVRNASCGSQNGRVTISASGNGILYSINGTDFQTNNVFTGLQAGSYSAYVRDQNGCTDETRFTIREGSLSVSSVNVTNTACGNSTGRIIATVTGTNPIEYRLEGRTNWQSSNSFTGLTPGNYRLQIRDGAGCIVTRNARVRAIVNASINVVGSDCHISNGSITVNVSTAGSWEYAIDGGPFQASNIFTDLAPGNYRVTYRTTTGECLQARNVIVSEIESITNVNVISTQTSCIANTGTLEVTATGTGLIYSISGQMNDSNSTGQFSNLEAGSYTIQIEDVNGCTATRAATIDIANDVDDLFSYTSNASECVANTGELSITNASATSGINGYSLDGGPYQNSTTFTNVSSGMHVISVRSNAGCVREFNVSVPEINDISVESINITSPTYHCSGDGEIEVFASGIDVEYSINNVNFFSSGLFTGLDAGTYIVYMRSASGCQTRTGEIILNSTFTIADITIQSSTCRLANGRLSVLAFGNDLQYRVDGGDWQDENEFANLLPGTHIVEVSDENDCIILETVEILNEGFTEITDTIYQSSFCAQPNGELEIIATAEVEPIQYRINDSPFQSDSLFTGLGGGSYWLYAQSADGCTDSVSINFPYSFEIDYEIEIDSPICENDNGRLTVNASGGVGQFTYSLNGSLPQTTNQFENLGPGTYDITITDEVGCTVSETLSLERICQAILPTAICPNGNGLNERLKLIYYLPLQIDKYQIFNRWGELIYEQSDFISTENTRWWNGENSQPGVYMCTIEYQFEGLTIKRAGTFTLIH